MLIITFSNSILRNPQKQLSNLVHKNTAAYFCNNGEKQYPPDGMVIYQKTQKDIKSMNTILRVTLNSQEINSDLTSKC